MDANIADLYVEAPLMKEVEIRHEERTPHPDRESEGNTGFLEKLIRKSLLRYEEPNTREPDDHNPVTLAEAFQDTHCFMVVGPPGSGKTALTRYIARKASNSNDPLLCKGGGSGRQQKSGKETTIISAENFREEG